MTQWLHTVGADAVSVLVIAEGKDTKPAITAADVLVEALRCKSITVRTVLHVPALHAGAAWTSLLDTGLPGGIVTPALRALATYQRPETRKALH